MAALLDVITIIWLLFYWRVLNPETYVWDKHALGICEWHSQQLSCEQNEVMGHKAVILFMLMTVI